MKKLVIAVLAVASIAAVVVSWHFKPAYVKLELVACIQNPFIDVNEGVTDFHSEVHWWFFDGYPDLNYSRTSGDVDPAIGGRLYPYFENLKKWGIDFDELGIDFNTSNAVLSFSREIVKMKAKNKKQFLLDKYSTVSTTMSKKCEPSTILL